MVRHEVVRDLIGCLVLEGPGLRLLESFVEVFSATLAEVLCFVVLIKVNISGCLGQSLGCLVFLSLAVISIIGMLLLKLADVCFPPQVLAVDECDCLVSLVGGCVLVVGVESGVGTSLLR